MAGRGAKVPWLKIVKGGSQWWMIFDLLHDKRGYLVRRCFKAIAAAHACGGTQLSRTRHTSNFATQTAPRDRPSVKPKSKTLSPKRYVNPTLQPEKPRPQAAHEVCCC